jgi:hypothetical protein
MPGHANRHRHPRLGVAEARTAHDLESCDALTGTACDIEPSRAADEVSFVKHDGGLELIARE